MNSPRDIDSGEPFSSIRSTKRMKTSIIGKQSTAIPTPTTATRIPSPEEILFSLITAIEYSHSPSHRISHCDIKLNNILLNRHSPHSRPNLNNSRSSSSSSKSSNSSMSDNGNNDNSSPKEKIFDEHCVILCDWNSCGWMSDSGEGDGISRRTGKRGGSKSLSLSSLLSYIMIYDYQVSSIMYHLSLSNIDCTSSQG